jgi:hypothetical protein
MFGDEGLKRSKEGFILKDERKNGESWMFFRFFIAGRQKIYCLKWLPLLPPEEIKGIRRFWFYGIP